MRQIDLIVTHCSATPPELDWDVQDVRDVHVNEFGWSDVGYHYIIRRDGTVEEGRPLTRIGAHTKGHNATSIGICLIGGVNEEGKSEDNFEPIQKTALVELVQTLIKDFPNAKVLGHRDLSPDADGDGIVEEHEWLKDCPCFDVRKMFYYRGLVECNAKQV